MYIGIKKGMTQVFDEKGNVVPVTIIDVSTKIYQGLKNSGTFLGIGSKKHPKKSEKGIFGDEVPKYYLPIKSVEEVGIPEVGSSVKITARSKGRGFIGVVKLWGFAGGPKTHGQSNKHRSPGSIGTGTTFGRVLPGLKMANKAGNKAVTIRNLKVVDYDEDNKLLLIKGSIPGSYGTFVKIM
ncbi:MAG: 50S ribosomal protein L3 [Candidatus Dojkabacteria bacterium]|nr:50S ribosomal protein L3 [Candidatus Dojkabacteria bacterium]